MKPLKDRIDELQRQLDSLREEHEASQAAQAESGAVEFADVDTPQVRQAAQKLAEAIASAQGHDLPLRMGEGSLPVLNLDPDLISGLSQFGEFGGVGFLIVSAPPTEAARNAA